MYCYIKLLTSGHVVIVPRDSREFDIDTLQKEVKGFIEIVNCYKLGSMTGSHDYRLVIDDEGKLKGKPVNDLASSIYSVGDYIVGDAILCREIITEDGDHDIGLFTKEEAQKVIHTLNSFRAYDPDKLRRCE